MGVVVYHQSNDAMVFAESVQVQAVVNYLTLRMLHSFCPPFSFLGHLLPGTVGQENYVFFANKDQGEIKERSSGTVQ